MFSIFYRTIGVVHIADKGKTINSQYYIESCLKLVVKALEIDRPKCGIKFLNDNARPNVLINVNYFLMKHGITTIQHPPYSHVIFGFSAW